MSARIVAYIVERAVVLRRQAADHRAVAANESLDHVWKPEAIAAARLDDIALELERMAGSISAGKHELPVAPEGPPAAKAPPVGVPWGGERG